MPVEEIRAIVRHAHDKGALVYMDDAGGARVGPAGFAQPRMLELGVISVPRVSTNTARSALVSGCWPGGQIWSPAFG